MFAWFRKQRRDRAAPAEGRWAEATVVVIGLDGIVSISEAATRPRRFALDLHKVIARAVGRHGGRVSSFDTDGAICAFGEGGTGDGVGASVGAVRAAREVAEAVASAMGDGGGLTARAGVATGMFVDGVVGGEAGRIWAITGGALRRAMRLQRECRAARVAVLMCAETARRAMAAFDARAVAATLEGDEDGAGFEPVARGC